MTDSYAVEAVIGRSATGVVYRARTAGGSGRVVAYKRVLGGDPLQHRRLRADAEALAALNHPNIVRIFDVVDDGAELAIVLQYAAGGSLADRLSSQQVLRPPEAAAVLIALADALASAHARGVMHRDIKPSNILFTGDGHPLLSDFAAASGPSTATGLPAAGTAEYLDPHVAAGGDFDERSDIYALAVLGYEMITGRRPGPAAPMVPGPVGAVLSTAAAPNPDDRPATARAFAASLRDAARTRHVAVPAPAPPQPRVEPRTREFGPRPPRRSAEEAPEGAVPWRRVAAGALALAIVPSLIVAGVSRDASAAHPPAAPAARLAVAPALPPCPGVPRAPSRPGVIFGDLAGRQCASWVHYSDGVVAVAVPGRDKILRVRLGRRDDQVVLGDWDCNGTDTIALYEPATGHVFEFDRWPGPDQRLRSTQGYDSTILGGTAKHTIDRQCDAVTVVPRRQP